jgi:tRNA1(Val) A37 N6-methylase TrmN6
MFQKKEFYALIKDYNIKSIEQHIIFYFIEEHNIIYQDNSLIKTLMNFEIDDNLFIKMKNLKILDIKELENYLELLIPEADKKLNGAFFTPSSIVNFIINEVAPKESDKCVDPSCGSGAFLIGLVEYFRKKYNKSIQSIIKENIYGYDLLPYNIERAKILLTLYALMHKEDLGEKDFKLFCQNSLTNKIDIKFDIVVGNPPYIKFQDLDEYTRNYLLKNFKTTIKGTFNTYFSFFELGYNLLNNNGRMGYISPNNFFTSLAGQPLREFFQINKSIYKIIDFKDIKIFDAQTYTALTFINKDINNEILYDKISGEKDYKVFLNKLDLSSNSVDALNVKKWRLLKNNEKKNIENIETIGIPLKELFDISVGVATLKDEVFFVNGVVAENGMFMKKTKNGIFFIEKEITKPVYKISHMKSQDDIDNNSLRIITPYKIEQNKAIPINEEEFAQKFPYCYEYLLSEKEILKNRDKGKKELKPFYQWGRTQGLVKKGKRILNPTFSKEPRFFPVFEEEAYYTNGYGIFFHDSAKNATLFDTVHPLSSEDNIFQLQKILNSSIMDYYIKTTSVTIQGGYPCYQKNFIEKFTIPYFTTQELNELSLLESKKEINNFLCEKYQVRLPTPNLVS